MFKALFGSLAGKLTSLALLVAGLSGGMFATGGLPTFMIAQFTDQAPAAAPAPAGSVALDFPQSELARKDAQPVQVEAAPVAQVQEPVVETITEIVQAPAPVAPPKCVGELQGLVTGLLNSVQSITSPEQAQSMLGQAASIGEASKGCAAQATASGNLGLDSLGKITEQLIGAVGQIQALPILAPSPAAGAAPAGGLGAVTGLVTKGVETTLGGVNKITGLLGDGLGLLLN